MVDIKKVGDEMTEKLEPKDLYSEYVFESYRDVDDMLSQCYPNDMDIEIYYGTLVDNIIGYSPDYARAKFNNAQQVTKSSRRHYQYVIVLEEYVNSWSSRQRVYFTDDEEFVDAVRKKLESN